MMRSILPKVLYGAVFTVVLPLVLALWAFGARNAIHLATPRSIAWGFALAATGMCVMLLGMLSLWIDGGGLPMNAFPPPMFVRRGVYSLVPHPIYGGFVIVCAGASIVCGSASGLWLVTPCVTLACAALVLGYEMPDLRKRFGEQPSSWLAEDKNAAPKLIEKLRIYPVILLPWLVIFELLMRYFKPVEAVATYLPFEAHLPVIEWMELPYASTYLVVLLTPMLVGTSGALRRFAVRGVTAMALVFPLYLLLPFFVPPRSFTPATALSGLLLWERTPYSGVAAFPSFHILWALIAASALGEGSRWKKIVCGTWAALVAVSCIATGMHSILDVLAGVAVFVLVANAKIIWALILRYAECIANSWREWRIGSVRIINHGGYAAAATFAGMLMICALLGDGYELLPLSIFVFATLGAAFWAQWVEGSPALLRPMGFYGGMIGAILGAFPALFMGIDPWIVLAAICVAAPWLQGIGRLRCLVQGCCHGRAAERAMGIRYTHPSSRVCRLAKLTGVAVHATQVYSILWNVVVGLALLRLLQLRSSSTLLCGVYLLLSGAGRFVEEAYRGEPQTVIVCGLRLYQWIVILTAVAGAVVTTVNGSLMPRVAAMHTGQIVLAAGCGLAAWFVTGVDFPESMRRFARLT